MINLVLFIAVKIFQRHIGLPIGCLGDIIELLHSLGIKTEVIDERFGGSSNKR